MTPGHGHLVIGHELEALEPAELQRLVLAQQIARENEQRRALGAFLDVRGVAGGESS
ncbi:hypothetical protein ACFU98_34735 [Streptomyces sp. NPDC057575]|uniref:hypothetical protein n=1 Tax=unclassified Streptomyces TaxID=2593676 RepID=UPI00367F113C